MPTPRNHPAKNATRRASPSRDTPSAADHDTDASLTADESSNLQDLSFDDDSRSDRHEAIGSAQSAQNDNAPDESIDEDEEGNDIAEQEED